MILTVAAYVFSRLSFALWWLFVSFLFCSCVSCLVCVCYDGCACLDVSLSALSCSSSLLPMGTLSGLLVGGRCISILLVYLYLVSLDHILF